METTEKNILTQTIFSDILTIFKYVAIHTMKFLMTSTPIKKGAEKKTVKVINSYLVTQEGKKKIATKN